MTSHMVPLKPTAATYEQIDHFNLSPRQLAAYSLSHSVGLSSMVQSHIIEA